MTLTPLQKLGYAAAQSARVGWFLAHYMASARYRQTPAPKSSKHTGASRPGPSRQRISDELVALFARDLANIEAGIYAMPMEGVPNPVRAFDTTRRYFADLPKAARRKREGAGREVYSAALRGRFPAYYLNNFHYQTDGYLSADSARLYDHQVEVLFSGTANAMRRQCLAPLHEFMRGRDQRRVHVADIACGTGRLLRFIKRTWPRIKASGVDLSPAYLEEARRHLEPFADVALVAGKAEALPFADASVDVITTVYLFHEIPPKVRLEAVREFHRVLKPGGRLVFMDSLQYGDVGEFDGLLERFPLNFHEPYYPSYARQDLTRLFTAAGFTVSGQDRAFLSKLVICDKA